jgi:cytochrome P450/NADPH-cytochrome P450 reductase
VTLTYSVLEAPSLSGTGRHLGVASSYLASLAPGDKLHVSVRPSHTAFHPPVDGEKTPLICVAAGTGIAPFRGFIQERVAMIAAGRALAPAVLFFGCRDPEVDDLYRAELDRWQALGAVDVRRAYSRRADAVDSMGCKYVQDRMWMDRKDVVNLWQKGARVYVCGSREVGESVKTVVIKIAMENAEENCQSMSEEKALKWFEGIKNERYATDVFA